MKRGLKVFPLLFSFLLRLFHSMKRGLKVSPFSLALLLDSAVPLNEKRIERGSFRSGRRERRRERRSMKRGLKDLTLCMFAIFGSECVSMKRGLKVHFDGGIGSGIIVSSMKRGLKEIATNEW